MDRERLVPVVLALLAVVALGAAAATLDTTVGSDSVGSGEAVGPGDRDSFSTGATNVSFEDRSPAIPIWIFQLLFVVMGVVAVVTLVYMLYRDGKEVLRQLLVGLVVFVFLFGFILLLSRVLNRDGQTRQFGLFSDRRFSLPGGASQADRVPEVATEPPVAALLLAIVVIVGLAIVVYRSTDDDASEPPAPPEPEQPAAVTLEAVGGAAGRAADEIEDDVAVSNAVYRAWRDMTGYLDVPNPNASTPGEFTDAAVDAGMRRRDVEELTSLFELTRYGGRDVTADRATRAVDALRRIEREYETAAPATDADGPDREGPGGRGGDRGPGGNGYASDGGDA